MAEQVVSIKTAKTAKSSQSSASFVVDTSSLKEIGKRLRAGNPAVAKQLRVRMRSVGEIVATEAKAQASWSSRIPQSIVVRVSGFSVKVVAGGPKAPDAAPYENGGQAGSFRHPLFGDTAHWYAQRARPFLAPASDATASAVEAMAGQAIEDTLREVGII